MIRKIVPHINNPEHNILLNRWIISLSVCSLTGYYITFFATS